MSPEEFVAKWSRSELSERAASQEHFVDLCRLIGQPTPAEADPTGENYCFEKAVKVVAGASKGSKGEGGFVDVWKRGCFGWEYKRKGKYKSLDHAYRQLYQYRDALDNPPLSIVSDIQTTEIRTHFTGYPTEKQVIHLEELPAKLHLFVRAFTNPESFKAGRKSSVEVTSDLAKEFGELADRLIARFPPNDLNLFQRAGDPVAHFLMKVMFCLFAEKIRLLPDGVFTRLVNRCLFEPENFAPFCAELFEKMKRGGWYGNDRVEYFNGGLFDDAPPIALNSAELNALARAVAKPWDAVEPSIFGTLFERILDPKKRAQIGAHYTSKDDILLVVDPVVMTPLRRAWQAIQHEIAPALAAHDAEPDRKKRSVLAAPITIAVERFRQLLHAQRVLDPACGSGNFLYVALQRLLDLEDEVVRFAATHDVYIDPTPRVRPTQMHGIEINPYAAELAQVVVWIGYLQWMNVHGISDERRPILDKLETIENRDAILDQSDEAHPKRAEWPEAEFIIGNPPFLGSKLFRQQGLADEYLEPLWKAYDLPRASDLCCYWFEQAKERIANPLSVARAGLLATQGIRGGVNRSVLDRIKAVGDIFMAWSDRDWVLEGAAVHVSIVGFDNGADQHRTLDGNFVDSIAAGLRSGINVTAIRRLAENRGIAFMGDTKGGPFDIDFQHGRELIRAPNPHGRSSIDVVKPWANGSDLTRRPRGMLIVDFGTVASQSDIADYEAPFHYVEEFVKPERVGNRRTAYAERWWLHVEPRPAMRARLPADRFLVTPNLTKYRLFSWVDGRLLPDHQLIAFGRNDDYMFGVLQSSIHESWALLMGTQLENRPRYTPSTTFETYPLPWLPGKEDIADPAYQRISAVAKAFDQKRERWLNPPEWIDPLAAKIDAEDDFADIPADARPLIRRWAIMAAAAKDPRLKNRTLTKLYNERPTWLRLAHEQLDRAVLAAYAATDPDGDWDEAWAAVWVESGAGQPLAAEHPLAAERGRVDQRVLANLLRLNQVRAGGVIST